MRESLSTIYFHLPSTLSNSPWPDLFTVVKSCICGIKRQKTFTSLKNNLTLISWQLQAWRKYILRLKICKWKMSYIISLFLFRWTAKFPKVLNTCHHTFLFCGLGPAIADGEASLTAALQQLIALPKDAVYPLFLYVNDECEKGLFQQKWYCICR